MHSFLSRVFVFVAFSGLAFARAVPSATIHAGDIIGSTCPNGASAFLSIPFAKPPTGDLRWKSPQAYNETFPANGLNATTQGALCVQFGGVEFTEQGNDSEDCLYLNVWVPQNANSTSNLPVKVWVHGGGDQGGGTQNPIFDGCNLAGHDTLVVSISYRLGPLGFLALDSAGIGGNFGIQDILLGLEWVQSNIAAFGGNPKKTVLFGQSAGALNTFIISTLPQATSLISSAIYESGYGPQIATPDKVNDIGTKYAAALNCSATDATCLRSVLKSALKAAAPVAPFAIVYSDINPASLGFQPYVDGSIIPAQPWSTGPKVPMIIGSNSLEGGLFTLGTYGVEASAANYSSFLTTNFGPAASAVAERYPLTMSAFASTGKPAFAAIATVMTEAMFLCPIHQALLKAESNNIPVYTYLNSHTPSCPAVPLPIPGATHNTEVPYVFGNAVNQQGGNCNFSAAEKVISEELIASWSAMASTGNPSVPGAWEWPQWDNNTSKGVSILNASSVGVVDYSACAFWDMVDNTYLNFTNSSAASSGTNTTSAGGGGSGSKTGSGTQSRAVTGLQGLLIAVSISVFIVVA